MGRFHGVMTLNAKRLVISVAAVVAIVSHARAQTPIHGHYPPGQTGLRGAAFPPLGWSITDFNRFFSNLEIKDDAGNTIGQANELRYANIAVVNWTSDATLFGMNYGAYVGVPFATGDLNPENAKNASLGLGDIIVTPLALYGKESDFDYQFQFSVWTPSGEFRPGGLTNRGSGFWSLIYSAGAVWYPGGDRDGWSLSAIGRIEQNLEQAGTGITPGDNLDLDWGIGRMIALGGHAFDIGASGFATWQISSQSGGEAIGRYRYYGAGPELSTGIATGWALRLRFQWEFGTENAVQGNNIWLIVNYQP
jgi:hypothetical protein